MSVPSHGGRLGNSHIFASHSHISASHSIHTEKQECLLFAPELPSTLISCHWNASKHAPTPPPPTSTPSLSRIPAFLLILPSPPSEICVTNQVSSPDIGGIKQNWCAWFCSSELPCIKAEKRKGRLNHPQLSQFRLPPAFHIIPVNISHPSINKLHVLIISMHLRSSTYKTYLKSNIHMHDMCEYNNANSV